MPNKKSATATTTFASSSSKKHRRASSNRVAQPSDRTPSTRSSKRLKRTEFTASPHGSSARRSKYFNDPEDKEESGGEAEAEASGYEDEDLSASQTSELSSEEDDYSSDEDEKLQRKRKSKQNRRTSQQVIQGKHDLWREGVKTGLGPGKAVFIEKPKARGDGGTKYVPEKIHPNTLEFLKDLKKNNDRIWLKAHNADYRTSWKDFETFVEALTERIVEVDETIPELPPKDLVFRIYRDVRFSSDPTPYKPHFSAAWSRTGRKGPYACYYVHIQPGKCFVGSGLWHPEAAPVALLRTDIDRRPERLRSVLMEPNMRKHIFRGISKDEKKAAKAFCDQNKENALKTKPKGYEADNPNIELLRLKNFTLGASISDQEILSPKALDKIVELISIMHPFVSYLNGIVMPDDAPDEGTEASLSSSNSDAETG